MSSPQPAFHCLNLPNEQRPYLRVGIISPSLNMGGAERWFLTLMRHFRAVRTSAFGFTGTLWNASLADEAQRSAKLFTVLDIGRGTRLDSERAVIETVAAESDVLLIWGTPHSQQVCYGLGIPIIDVSHNERLFLGQSDLCRQAAGGVNFVVGVSGSSLEAYPPAIARTGYVIYNGGEIDRVSPRRPRKFLRDTQGWTDNDKVILFLGRLVGQKHPELLLDLLDLLPAEWKAAFVGHGEKLASVQNAAARYPGRAAFFPAAVHVGDFFEMSDVFVLPSEAEGMPITVAEAWLAGIPTVLSNLGYVQEIEKIHGVEMCYKVNREPNLQLLLEQVQKAVELGRSAPIVINARTMAWHHYTASAMTYRWEEFLIWICNNWQHMMLHVPSRMEARPKSFLEMA